VGRTVQIAADDVTRMIDDSSNSIDNGKDSDFRRADLAEGTPLPAWFKLIRVIKRFPDSR
jgi:hypothetical protein